MYRYVINWLVFFIFLIINAIFLKYFLDQYVNIKQLFGKYINNKIDNIYFFNLNNVNNLSLSTGDKLAVLKETRRFVLIFTYFYTI